MADEPEQKPSATCEVLMGRDAEGSWLMCGKPTFKAYPAMGGGYMALCREHGKKHPEAWPIQEI